MPSGRQRHPSNPSRVKEAARRPTGRGTCPARVPAPARRARARARARGTNQTKRTPHTAHAEAIREPIDRAPSYSAAFWPVSRASPRAGPSCRGGRGGRTHERRADETGVSRCGSRCPAPRSLAHEPHGCVPPPSDTRIVPVPRATAP